MSVREILLLGNPKLHEVSAPVTDDEFATLRPIIKDLHDTLLDFRSKYTVGRAIAAPQIGVIKRIVYMFIDKPVVFVNPKLDQMSTEMIELWDDCMSFPELLVRVKRHQSCRVAYRNLEGRECLMMLEDSLSELLQHECDHLDGVLAVSRATDAHSFALKSQKSHLKVD